MTAAVITPALIEPLAAPRPTKAMWISRGLSVLLLAAVIVQLQDFDIAKMFASMPLSPAFWLSFLALYFALPLADLAIFRRLWGLGWAEFPVLLRKRIANELVLSYSGEAWFYLWARNRSNLRDVAFGAIKDVNILSALVANLATLAALALAYPFVKALDHGQHFDVAMLSVGAVLAVSFLVLLFRKLLFALPVRHLVWVSGVHGLRLLLTTGLLGLCWHLTQPEVPIGMWLMLAALRLVISRLPLLPAREILFTSVSVFLLGAASSAAATLALLTALTLGLHLLLAMLLAITGFSKAGAGETA